MGEGTTAGGGAPKSWNLHSADGWASGPSSVHAELRNQLNAIVKLSSGRVPAPRINISVGMARDLLAALDEQAKVIERLRVTATDARNALDSLPEDCLGTAIYAGEFEYMIRDELIEYLDEALAAAGEKGIGDG